MRRFLLPIIAILVIFLGAKTLTIVPKVLAQSIDENFSISVQSDYSISENGTTILTQNIQIKNKKEFIYTPTYTVSTGFEDIEKIQAFDQSGSIPFTLVDQEEGTSIKLSFPRRFIGLNTINNFTLKFETSEIAKKNGNIWKVSIPGISSASNFTRYDTTIQVPQSFGLPNIVKPPKKIQNTDQLKFTKEDIGRAGVFMIFGDNQYYTFNLKYNISNPNLFPVKTEIALPPDTNYQQSLILNIKPQPLDVTVDGDGNWIAEYRLLPKARQTIIVDGIIRVKTIPSKSTTSAELLKKYLEPDENWEVDNPEIQKLAIELGTPRKIYDYVVETLEYNYEKINTNNIRLGAMGALGNPTNSVCLEFSDLFVTLNRAIGIPSRSLEGFAYTDNARLRPLSLIEDILHAWPEYYDSESETWIMVDPTWGNTTKGIDYFETLDLEHIVFVIKGEDSTYPIPAGGYKFDPKSKDVKVEFGDPADFKVVRDVEIIENISFFSLPGFPLEGEITIKNKGNSAISDSKVIVKAEFSDTVKEYEIGLIPPYGKKTFKIRYDDVPFLTNRNYQITIQFEDKVKTKNVKISFFVSTSVIIIGGGIIFGSIIISIVAVRTWRIFIQRHKKQDNLRRQGKKS